MNIWPNKNRYTVNQKKLLSKTTIPANFFKIYAVSSIFYEKFLDSDTIKAKPGDARI